VAGRIIAYACAPVAEQSVMPSHEHRSVAFIATRELSSLRLADGYRQAIAAWRTS
jgi:hypothetical protein